MNDHALVAALRAGDSAALADMYEAYADRVYAYCRWLLDDPEAAEDAVVDAFVVAYARAGRLRQPERLRAWLYAITRSRCGGRTQSRRRGTGQLGSDQQELLQLVDRHRLPVAETGVVVGLPSHRVRELLAEARADAATERIAREPFPAAPELLWPRLQLRALDPGLRLEREKVLRRVGRLGSTGFPRPWRARQRRRVLVVAGLAGALVLGGGGAAVMTAAAVTTAAPPPPPPSPVPTTVAEIVAATTAPAATPTPTPSPTLPTTPSPTPPPPVPTTPPTPTTRPAPPPPPPLTVTATVDVDCPVGGVFGHRLTVAATASESLATAELHLSGRRRDLSFPMEIDGSTAWIRTDLLRGERYDWWVEVGTDSTTAGTDPVTIRDPCG